MNRQIKNKKPEIKPDDARDQAITRAVELYFAGRPLLKIRKSTGVDCVVVGRYVRLLCSAWMEIQAPSLCGRHEDGFVLAVTDDQTRLARAAAREASS